MKSAVDIFGAFMDAIADLGGHVTPRGGANAAAYKLNVRNVATITFDVSVPTQHQRRVETLVDQLATDLA